MNESINDFEISGRKVGCAHPPFIIAEMSGNHNHSLERALKIVDAAADAGAHGLKLQTYTPETMTLDIAEREFFIEDKDSLWKGASLYELYREAMTPWEWHEPIFAHAKRRGLVAFSTPFDVSAVDFLEKLGAPLYKIASFENGDLPLIRRVAQTKKPVVISTGMAELGEIDQAVRAARQVGNEHLVLLKCTSSYPASPIDSNLNTIPYLRDCFHTQVGLSDHTMGVGVAVASIALGATVIEKHFTLSRAEGGVDSAFSMEPHELKQLVEETRRAHEALGKVSFGAVSEKERSSLRFRRSLYITEDMKAGDALSERNLRAIRPGFGLPTRYLDVLLGKRINRNVSKGTPVSWDLLG